MKYHPRQYVKNSFSLAYWKSRQLQAFSKFNLINTFPNFNVAMTLTDNVITANL